MCATPVPYTVVTGTPFFEMAVHLTPFTTAAFIIVFSAGLAYSTARPLFQQYFVAPTIYLVYQGISLHRVLDRYSPWISIAKHALHGKQCSPTHIHPLEDLGEGLHTLIIFDNQKDVTQQFRQVRSAKVSLWVLTTHPYSENRTRISVRVFPLNYVRIYGTPCRNRTYSLRRTTSGYKPGALTNRPKAYKCF